jgi:hypothetical protein
MTIMMEVGEKETVEVNLHWYSLIASILGHEQL